MLNYNQKVYFCFLKSKKWIPMHYGTFDLSDEPIFYPEQILKEHHKTELENIIWMHIGKRIPISN